MAATEWTCSINGKDFRVTKKVDADGNWWCKLKPSGTESAFGAHYTSRSEGREDLHFDYYIDRRDNDLVTLSEQYSKRAIHGGGPTNFDSSPYKDVFIVPTDPSTRRVDLISGSGSNCVISSDGPCLLISCNTGSDFHNPIPKRRKPTTN